MSVPSGPADPLEEFKLKVELLLPPVDTNEYLLPQRHTHEDYLRHVIALRSAIRREQHDNDLYLDREKLFNELLTEKYGDLFKIAAHPAFERVVLVTMVNSIATFSTPSGACNAGTDETVLMAKKYSEYVIHWRSMGMSNRAIAIALAVRLELRLSHNVMCNAAVPLTPPPSPYCSGIGICSEIGAVRFGSATDEVLIDLVENYYMKALQLLYINALQHSYTNRADLVALVRASAKLCKVQADMCQGRADKLTQEWVDAWQACADALQAQVDALQAEVDALQAEGDAMLGIMPGE